MKPRYPLPAATLALLSATAALAQQALPVPPAHRYRFDNPAAPLADGAQILDSIGGAHGLIRGAGASADGTGVRLPGGSPASAAYIDLPNHLASGSAAYFPGLADATYEVWITVHSAQNWSRILDFGNNSADEIAAPGGSFNGADYLMVSATVGTTPNIRFERGGQYLTGGATQDIAGATTLGARMHVVATYDGATAAWRLYRDGALLSTRPTLLGPATLDDLNVWLGRSNWSGDSNTDATYDEFRVYDYALSAQEILGNYQAGPDVLTSDGQPPVFAANPLAKPSATVGAPYSASLAGDASDLDPGDTLTFTKTAGLAWLDVAPDGALSGTPGSGTVGNNSFTVRATDSRGLFAETSLTITVANAGLPSGWSSGDIGSVGVAGYASANNGVYTLGGSGADIGGTADAFQYTWQPLAGDGEIRARVSSQTANDPLAKAGVMIRDGSAAGALNALVATTPSNGFRFQWRSTLSGATGSVDGPALNPVPNNWVRLTRSGSLLTGYVSANGAAWTQVGVATLPLSASVSAGLAVTSRNNAALGSATFEDVAITPYPAPWLSADIGATGLVGSAEFFGGAHTVKGAGAFGGANDAFRYVYQPLVGDGSIIARVGALQDTGSGARVGIMIRDTLAANARMAALTVTGSGAYRWQRRTTAGGSVSTTNSGNASAPNLWVRLVRSGNTLTASKSTNGASWTTIGSATVTLASTCHVGLVVASGATTTLNTSTLDNVTATP